MIWNPWNPVNGHGIRFSIGIGFIDSTGIGINFGNFSGICSIGVGTGIDTGFGTGISTVPGTCTYPRTRYRTTYYMEEFLHTGTYMY